MMHIDPERWQQVESLLDKVWDLDPSERVAHVHRSAGGDTWLVEHVLRLLRASGEAGTFLEDARRPDLEEALVQMSSTLTSESADEVDMERAGPYRLLRRLGRGGMGQVYLGVRDDEAFKRYVAVKVIRRGMDTEDILKRFRVERRILASLNHPGIAQLFDGGATDEGESYFVMEYVDGKPITDHCTTHRLSLYERLRLFRRVCAAVHYAHQNLIVHRDLKPSNILVTEKGEVKLLDFGIAKFLNPEVTGYTLPMTREEQRIMTPEYASPEQVRGQNLTTASDVYQLGVLLYELLTGCRPFSFPSRRAAEIEKIILEEEPDKPSNRMCDPVSSPDTGTSLPASLTGRQRGKAPQDILRKQLRGDLDRIVLMALRKDVDRRYQSADQLQADIGNFLSGHPVTAQEDRFGYRFGKFVRRNKVGMALGMAALLVLLATTAAALWSASVTERQRQQVALEAEKSREVVNFLVDLFEKADPEYSQGRQLTVREMVDIGVEDVQERLAEHPLVQGELMRVLSLVYAGLGEEADGMRLATAAWDRQQALSGSEPTPELASALYAMGVLKDDTGDPAQSRQFHEQALAMRRQLYGNQNLDVAQSLNDLGVTMYGMGLYDTTRVVWEEALAIRSSLLGPSHRDIAESLSNLGAVHGDLFWLSGSENLQRFEEAASYYARAIAMTRQERGENHPFYASNLHNYAVTLLDRGRLTEAESKIEEAIAKRTLIYGRQSDVTSRSINMMGRIRMAQGKLDEAAKHFEESFDIHLRMLGPRHVTLGIDHTILGDLDVRRDRRRDAVAHYRAALDIFLESLPAANRRVVETARRLGHLLEETRDLAEAERHFALAVDAFAPKGPQSARHVSDLINLARVQMQSGRRQAAEGHLAAAAQWLAENPDEALSAQIEAIRG